MTKDTAPTWKRGFYRSRSGVILGVCKGMAQHLDISAFWMRVIWIAAFIFTTGWPIIIAYFIAAVVMKPEPVVPFETESDREFYESYTSSRQMALNRLKRTYESLDRRIRRMETIVTSKDFHWDRKMNS